VSRNETGVEAPPNKKAGSRRLFYGSIVLLLSALLLAAIGAVSNWPLLMLVGVVGILGAMAMQLAWLVRKIG
jgi:hypothetical protein